MLSGFEKYGFTEDQEWKVYIGTEGVETLDVKYADMFCKNPICRGLAKDAPGRTKHSRRDGCVPNRARGMLMNFVQDAHHAFTVHLRNRVPLRHVNNHVFALISLGPPCLIHPCHASRGGIQTRTKRWNSCRACISSRLCYFSQRLSVS